MAKVYAGELSGGAIANCISLLENEAADTENLKAAINSFVTGTIQILTGPAYDAARSKAESYITLLTTRARIAKELASAIRAATSDMSSYMEGYSELDDSKLPEITTELNSIKATIEQIKYNYYNSQSTNSQSSTTGYSSLVAPYEAQYKELNKLREKLLYLTPTDANAYGKLGLLSAEVSSYSTTVSSTTASSIST